MDSGRKVPRRLFKYRELSSRTLAMLITDEIFYADPRTFNDPLDARPSLNLDINVAQLQNVLRRLVEQRVHSEMSVAAKTMRSRGPKTAEHIDRHCKYQAEAIISEIAYLATDPSYEIDDPEHFLLGQYIEDELLRQYDKGIFSLAGRLTCPLMWSHYGDQHRGICLGYSIPTDAAANLHKIKYGGSRLVDASEIAKMLDGDELARHEVNEAVLLRKAASWRYEREWRMIERCGLQDSPLELDEVIFGMRCERPAMYAVFKALEDRSRRVKFYKMQEEAGTFNLRKLALDTDELGDGLPFRSRSTSEMVEKWFEHPEPQNVTPERV